MRNPIRRALSRLGLASLVTIALLYLLLNRDYQGGSEFEWAARPPGSEKPVSLHPILRNGLWGYIDNDGKIRIRPQFNAAADFCENRAAVAVGNPERRGYIRPDGSGASPLPAGAVPCRTFQ